MSSMKCMKQKLVGSKLWITLHTLNQSPSLKVSRILFGKLCWNDGILVRISGEFQDNEVSRFTCEI